MISRLSTKQRFDRNGKIKDQFFNWGWSIRKIQKRYKLASPKSVYVILYPDRYNEYQRNRYHQRKKQTEKVVKIPQSITERVATWRAKNNQKAKAQRAVYNALKRKDLVKENCFCGAIKVEAHHEDYSKPLDVIWLCKKHHVDKDKERRAKLN